MGHCIGTRHRLVQVRRALAPGEPGHCRPLLFLPGFLLGAFLREREAPRAAHTMVLGGTSSSSSSVQILDPIPARSSGTTPVDTSDSDDDGSCFGGDGGAASAPRWPAAGRIASSFRSQKALDALCKKHGVDTREFAPLPAGGLRACSPPPAGAVCVYADALEAGMRVPLHGFFCEALAHFGVAVSNNLDMCVCVAPWVCSWRA